MSQSRSSSPVSLTTAFLLPIIIINAIGFILPIVNLAKLSFAQALVGGGIGEAFTIDNWASLIGDSYYGRILLNSVLVSLAITLLALLCSYPIAFFLHRTEGRLRTMLTVLVISPLLTSAVVRTYGWVAILSDTGLIPSLLGRFGVQAPPMMFNTTGVIVGLTEILMPYMILALLAGFGRLDSNLEDAARSLGASEVRVFRRIILPLTLPGIALGCLLVFVLAISSFITPKLLGGGRVFLLATEIYDQAMVTLNWPLAATLSMLVLVVFGVAVALYARILRQLSF
ncbi:ABC transporter permease [Rhizobium miluonense]|uniref:Putative spermidine/putrescine transport system permease protein n=1 Tax=Rhizobium miluonense TaxID=411945 RepID=A0A1C3WCL3_9HYPH|nr:ABC transporter permease [Rhizobium miluonense]SCB37902.1 putative spermidine/putrescine transport system permease protein [Rhizobium miluonense]